MELHDVVKTTAAAVVQNLSNGQIPSLSLDGALAVAPAVRLDLDDVSAEVEVSAEASARLNAVREAVAECLGGEPPVPKWKVMGRRTIRVGQPAPTRKIGRGRLDR